ncbi:MAG TPA: esterase [Firmicutes bacterium]|nr:esterase [Bacillota bacterium]
MNAITVGPVPPGYKKAISEELRGEIKECAYPVRNYINSLRQLVTNQEISSAEAGRESIQGEPIIKKCNVYLPAGYDENGQETKYNVLYLLHGVGGNRYEWLCGSGQVDGTFVICNILDHLIANGDIEPLIIVFPEGRSAHDWEHTSFTTDETNILGFYYFDYELRYDLIPFIEANFNTYANLEDKSHAAIAYNRKHRAIAGLSMGGMQSLNLSFGGYRFDSIKYTKTASYFNNGLDKTVKAPGMQDIFAYVGAFSNAPTTSAGSILGSKMASSGHKMDLLYITCGDNDDIAMSSYEIAVNGLRETAGEYLNHYYQVLIKGGAHDFGVWNNGAYNFLRLCFGGSLYN